MDTKKRKPTQKDIDRANAYNSANYDKVSIMLRKGLREEWKVRARAEGKSLTQYIIDKVNA